MAVDPKLLNPTKVKISQKNESKQQYDHLRRSPINVVAKDAEFSIDAQVKWNIQIGEFANPQVKQEGVDEREMGYLILRTKDLKAINKVIKRGDRLIQIEDQVVQYYILRIEYGSHYGGKFKLIKAVFSDRQGQDG